MQDMNTRLLSVDFNTFRVVYLTNVPTLENFALILFLSFFGRNLVLTSGLGATKVSRGWQF